jgi:hypothetical protein
MTDPRILLIIDKWICNTAINRMRFTEDASELTDLPLVHLKIIRQHYTAPDSASIATLDGLIRDKERIIHELQSKEPGQSRSDHSRSAGEAAPTGSAT